MKEIWKPIKVIVKNTVYDYTGFYECSNLGKIRSLDKYDRKGKFHKGHLRKLMKGRSSGYKTVTLSIDGKRKTFDVHVIISQAFPEICGTWFKGCYVDHINANKTDNRAENLKIGTPSDNNRNPLWIEKQRKSHIGLMAGEKHPNYGKFGVQKKTSKTVEQYLNGRLIATYVSIGEAAHAINVDTSTISRCCSHSRNITHVKGYVFKYKEKK